MHASGCGLSIRGAHHRGNPSVPIGEPLKCCGPAYNAPAAIDVSHKKWGCCPLNFSSFVDLSFTYWFAGEEGLAIAETGVLNSSTAYFPEKMNTLCLCGRHRVPRNTKDFVRFAASLLSSKTAICSAAFERQVSLQALLRVGLKYLLTSKQPSSSAPQTTDLIQIRGEGCSHCTAFEVPGS